MSLMSLGKKAWDFWSIRVLVFYLRKRHHWHPPGGERGFSRDIAALEGGGWLLSMPSTLSLRAKSLYWGLYEVGDWEPPLGGEVNGSG